MHTGFLKKKRKKPQHSALFCGQVKVKAVTLTAVAVLPLAPGACCLPLQPDLLRRTQLCSTLYHKLHNIHCAYWLNFALILINEAGKEKCKRRWAGIFAIFQKLCSFYKSCHYRM